MSAPMPPVPNVLKTIIEGLTSFGKNWFTIFNWLYTGTPPSLSSLEVLAGDILSIFQTEFLPITPPSTSITKASAIDLSTVMMPAFIASNPLPGTSTADKLPANCSVLFNWPVSMRYRGGHPRNYVYCGTDENLLNESQWNPAFVTTAQDAINTVVDTYAGTAAGGTTISRPVAVSYFGGVPTVGGESQRRAVPLVLPLGAPTCNPFVGSQRRRIGRGS